MCRGLFVLLFVFSCTPNTETDWPVASIIKGDWLKVNTFGGSLEDVAHSVIITQDDGFAIIGNTQSTDNDFISKTREGSDFFVMKFDANAAVEWTQTYGGKDDDRGYDMIQLEDQGFALIGYSKSDDGDASSNQGQHDNWLIRIDNRGNFLWEKSFGFLGHDHAYSIIKTSDGGMFFNGFLDVTASNGEGNFGKQSNSSKKHGVGEFWCHKLDQNGDLQWSRYYGGKSNDRSYDAIETQDGNFLIVGTSESQDVDIGDPLGGYDIWVIKIDPMGSLIWEKSVGGSGYDGAEAVIENRQGDYVILGQSFSQDGDIKNGKGSSDIVIVTLTPGGFLKSIQNIGEDGFETGKSILERPDGTLIVLGHYSSGILKEGENPMSNNIILIHSLPNGSPINSYSLEGNGLDIGHASAFFKDGRVLIVGSTESTSGDFSKARGGKDIFLAFWY
jgi:hypothetical protein